MNINMLLYILSVVFYLISFKFSNICGAIGMMRVSFESGQLDIESQIEIEDMNEEELADAIIESIKNIELKYDTISKATFLIAVILTSAILVIKG